MKLKIFLLFLLAGTLLLTSCKIEKNYLVITPLVDTVIYTPRISDTSPAAFHLSDRLPPDLRRASREAVARTDSTLRKHYPQFYRK